MSTPVSENTVEHEMVEAFGVLFEDLGLPRMAGRIFGALLMSDAAQLSGVELAQRLSASAGSISSMTRELVRFGVIERVSLHGDRRSYFRIHESAWTALMVRRMAVVEAFRQAAARGVLLLGQRRPRATARLAELRDFYAFLGGFVPELLERWEKQRAQAGQP